MRLTFSRHEQVMMAEQARDALVLERTRTLVPLPAPPWQSRQFEKFIAVRWNVELSPLSHTRRSPSPRPVRPCQMDAHSHTPAHLIPNCLYLVILTTVVSAVTLTEILIHSSKKCAYDYVQTNKLLFFWSRLRPFQKRAVFVGRSAETTEPKSSAAGSVT